MLNVGVNFEGKFSLEDWPVSRIGSSAVPDGFDAVGRMRGRSGSLKQCRRLSECPCI